MMARREPPADVGREGDGGREYSRPATISRGIAGLVCRYTGRGPTKVRTTINTNVVVVVLKDALTKGEQNLVAAGQAAAVTAMRRIYHEAMRDEAVALVEEVLGRDVLSALTDVDAAKSVAVQVYVLRREPGTGTSEAVPHETG